MNIQDAIDVIESVSGFTDESTPVGEAWLEILSYINRPVSPVAEEVADLVAWFNELGAEEDDVVWIEPENLARAATLLQQLSDLAADAVSGLRYIEGSHGHLYGVGWDRVYAKADVLNPQLSAPSPVVTLKEENREFVLKEMKAEDGSSLGWYVNHSDFYCDIEKEDGVWGIYFRDKITDQDAYGEPNDN